MSFSFKKIKEKLVEGDFVYDDQTLHIKVDANAITPKSMSDLNAKIAAQIVVVTGMETQAASGETLAIMLSQMIDSWSAEDGKPTTEFLRVQPIGFLSDLLEFCSELVNPKKTTG